MVSEQVRREFDAMIRSEAYPCVGAKSALAQGAITFFEAETIDRSACDLPLYVALSHYGEEVSRDPASLQTFIAVFVDGPQRMGETDFEAALWDRLQSLHNIDMAHGCAWSDEGEHDPESPHFSMSIAGHAYFVVGMHPSASRAARRFPWPVMVFNLHAQFEHLRENGRFPRMKAVIRERDEALDGPNPMLDDFGSASEARQYSGRRVGSDWECPLEIRKPLHD